MRVRVVMAIHEKVTDGKCTLKRLHSNYLVCVACLPHIPKQM